MAGLRRRAFEWGLGVTTGQTIGPTEPSETEPYDFDRAKYTGPPRRTKEAMIRYAQGRNAKRWRRLQSDFEWLKQCMIEMDRNPEDARFLL